MTLGASAQNSAIKAGFYLYHWDPNSKVESYLKPMELKFVNMKK